MRDVTPVRNDRGRLRAVRPPGAEVFAGRVPERTYYSRQTRTISDMVEVTETLVTEPVITPHPFVSGQASSMQKQQATAHELAVMNQNLKAEVRKGRDLRRFGLIFIAGIFVLVTGYVSIDTIATNNRVKADTAPAAQRSIATDATTTKDEEASDETVIPESSLASYRVAPSLPRAVYSPDLSLAARVLPMSVNTDGSIQAPRNIFDAGWYNAGAKPGEPGAVFIDGHASGATRQGLFAYLDTLKPGNELQIEKGDSTRLTYRVVKVETVKLDEVDMQKVLQPYEGVTNGLNLMTCTGTWLSGQKTYDHRVIVWTEQV